MFRKLMLIIFAFTFFISCNLEEDNKVKGTVIYSTVEGGSYAISTDDGVGLEPINLDDEFKVHNLRIKFNYIERNDLVSYHGRGQIVELFDVEKID